VYVFYLQMYPKFTGINKKVVIVARPPPLVMGWEEAPAGAGK